jgi:hypothetical protein
MITDGKVVVAVEIVVSVATGGSWEEKDAQLVSVIFRVKSIPKRPNSELIVYVHTDIKLEEVPLNVSGFVTTTIGMVDRGQFIIPMLDMGI